MNIFAFIKRDFQIEKNYKLAFFLKLIGMFLYISIFYFMGFWIDRRGNTFGGSFFVNIFIGIIFANLLLIPLNCFSESLRKEQLFGTAENLFLAPANNLGLLAGSCSYALLFGVIETLFYLAALYLIVPGTAFNAPRLLLGLVLGLTSMSVLGILSASFILAFKKGDPVNFLMNAGLTLLGGVFFPINVLPGWLYRLASLNPITHALGLIRTGFGLPAMTPAPLRNSVIFLLVFSILGLIFAVKMFDKALIYTKKTGGLGKY